MPTDPSIPAAATKGELERVPQAPAIAVTLTLEPTLVNALREGQLFQAARDAAAHELGRLAGMLGVPGSVHLNVGELPVAPTSRRQWLKLEVNGVVCSYPDEALCFVHAYASDQVASPQLGEQTLLKALQEACAARFPRPRATVVDFFRLACADIASRQPGCFLTHEGLRIYLAGLADAECIEARFGSNPGALLSVLRGVLDLEISIADTTLVSGTLSAAGEGTASAVFEDLVEALRPDVVEVRLREDDLMQLRRLEPDGEETLLPFMREGLFQELGTLYPDLRIVVDDDLEDQYFSIKINHVTSTPVRGLGPDELFVNDTAERLKKYGALAALNPATWQPGAITRPPHKAALEANGLTTWTPWGYLILCAAASLRRLGGTFVHRPLVRFRLERLAEAYPAVVEQVLQRRTLDELTYLLRALAAEQISTRDLRAICERLLDQDFEAFEGWRYANLDDHIPLFDVERTHPKRPDQKLASLLRFLRAGLTRQLGHKFVRGTNTVVVYLLDEAFERMLLAASREGLTVLQREQALSALRAKLSLLPPTAQVPSVLTLAGARSILTDITRVALPHVSVISYEDLPANMNIQPVDRISLDAI